MTTATNIVTLWYSESNKEGCDLNFPQTINILTNPEFPATWIRLGEVVKGNNDSEWVRVVASTTVSANNVVAIDVNFSANNLTTTIASSLVYTYGIAEFQASLAAPGDYFWALKKASGGAIVNVSATAARGVLMYIAAAVATGGVLTTTASGTVLRNIYVNTSLVGVTAAVDVVIPGYIFVST